MLEPAFSLVANFGGLKYVLENLGVARAPGDPPGSAAYALILLVYLIKAGKTSTRDP